MRARRPPPANSFDWHGLGRTALALAMSVLFPSPALAQAVNEGAAGAGDCAAEETLRFRGGTARLENDLFTGTDQNYTNGVAFTLISHDIPGRLRPECFPAPIRLHGQLIQFMNPGFWADADNSADTQNVVVRFGQSMYTPEDYTRTDLIPDDRPYAGLLYMGLAWNRRKHEPESNREMLDTRENTLGVIGPWSLAEQTQNLVTMRAPQAGMAPRLRRSDDAYRVAHRRVRRPALITSVRDRPEADTGIVWFETVSILLDGLVGLASLVRFGVVAGRSTEASRWRMSLA